MSTQDDIEVNSRRRFLVSASAVAAGALALPIPASAKEGNKKDKGKRHKRRKRAQRFSSHPVNVGDVILGARSIGHGEPIVIHPSLARGALDFDPLARRLAAGGYRVISIDPRGIGGSWAPPPTLDGLSLHEYADDVLAVIRHFKLGKVHMLGHAHGNRVARTLATDHPNVVHSVILCACGGGVPDPDVVRGLATVTDPATSAAELRRVTRDLFFAPGNNPRPWYTGWYPEPGRAEALSSLRTEFENIEGGGDKPMLIVQGKEDIVAPPEFGHELRREFGRRITVRDIPDAGHAMIIEQTAAVAEGVLRWLSRHPIRRRRRRGQDDGANG